MEPSTLITKHKAKFAGFSIDVGGAIRTTSATLNANTTTGMHDGNPKLS